MLVLQPSSSTHALTPQLTPTKNLQAVAYGLSLAISNNTPYNKNPSTRHSLGLARKEAPNGESQGVVRPRLSRRDSEGRQV